MPDKFGKTSVGIVSLVTVSVVVTGYFIGLQSPMNRRGAALPASRTEDPRSSAANPKPKTQAVADGVPVIPATVWAEMNRAADFRRAHTTSLTMLAPPADLFHEFTITLEQKRDGLARRAANRAFNGAPPTVPHPVDQFSAAACVVCHGEGFISDTLRIPKMSHKFLANCTQCHVEGRADADFVPLAANRFSGLRAPEGGPRAWDSAPPGIPHSTWMRDNCLSCHGPTGLYGLRTTHPWRQSCLQCHAPSHVLEQSPLDREPGFLPAMPVSN